MKLEHQVKQLEARVSGLEQAAISLGLALFLISTIGIVTFITNTNLNGINDR
jgi:hypothetical protein